MKNEEFELKLLVKQNTEMSLKLQNYRRENQELTRKNQDLNCWVQNFINVFTSISSAWKIITDNQQGLYTLMRKKNDPNSKALIGKYISHFKAFEQIIANLGEKLTNQGHSNNAAFDAKARLNSFVSNYQLFFNEVIDTFFKFNEECLASIADKLKQPDLQQYMRQLAAKQIQNRGKIKQFESYISHLKDNLKVYETGFQHTLLDGLLLEKNKQIQQLKDRNQKQSRRIAYLTDYSSQNVNFVLENQNNLECLCGGAHLSYFNKKWEQNLSKKTVSGDQNGTVKMIEENSQNGQNKKESQQSLLQKQLLMQRNVQILAKFQKLKLQNKLTQEIVLQSPVFISLRNQFKDLMDYSNDLVIKLNKSYDYLAQLEKARNDEVDQIKKKYQKNINRNQSSQHIQGNSSPDFKFLINFKTQIQGQIGDLKTLYAVISERAKQKQQNLNSSKELMKALKKQNDDLNRKLSEFQQRHLKSIEQPQFRHSKFAQLETKVTELFKAQKQTEQLQIVIKTWGQFADYVKTRDKKIKAMEQVIRKRQKQINQKAKLQEILKNALSETENIYMQSKQKLDKFQSFMQKTEKQLLSLFQQNYKLKIESEQQKNILNIRFKTEQQARIKLQEKVKHFEKIEEQIKVVNERSDIVQKKMQDYVSIEKERINRIRLQLKQKERQFQQLGDIVAQKQKAIEKLIEEKERKNLQMNKMRMKLKSIEGKTQYEVLKMEMEEYKSKVMCRCGAERERQIVLKTCPHIFCKKCIEDTTASRTRKCPICSTRYTKSDIHQICWT